MFFRTRTLSLLPVLLLAMSGAASAQYGLPLNRDTSEVGPAQIRQIVANYCRLDYEGARLNSQDAAKFAPLVWSHTAADYSQMDVVARYTVDEPVLDHGRYDVTVHYLMLGRYDKASGFSRELARSTINVDFSVSSNNGEWKIGHMDPDFPHLSRAAMVQWLNDRLAKGSEDAPKQLYRQALEQLQPPAPAN